MPSLLDTDAYKFSMAEAGFPLRRETFYYSHRRGGPHFLPFDVAKMVNRLLPDRDGAAVADALQYLDEAGYRMGGAYRAALAGQLEIHAIPRGSWFFDREPVFSISGPSALVSWLEPLVLQLHYRIQIATVARLQPERIAEIVATVSCEGHRAIVLETLDAIGHGVPPMVVDPDGYRDHVRTEVTELAEITGDPARVFEIGMRAATCIEQHRLALEACRDVGVLATSNVGLARELSMRPVGTMGHEHVQRHGGDLRAFRAMRDRFPGPTSFLLDTYSTLDSGIPAALQAIAETPERHDAIRYDSGDKEGQYLYAAVRARSEGLRPRHILEDAFDAALTRRFEELRAFTGVAASDQLYGYGGHIVRSPSDPLTRNRVSAVWKLTQSGVTPTMKWADAPGVGKESLPGEPMLYRVYRAGSWTGLVAQRGEAVEAEAVPMTGQALARRVRFTDDEVREFARPMPEFSPGTRALVDRLYGARNRALGRGLDGA